MPMILTNRIEVNNFIGLNQLGLEKDLVIEMQLGDVDIIQKKYIVWEERVYFYEF